MGTVPGRHISDLKLHLGAITAVDHAIQVVAPVRKRATAAIAQRHCRLAGERLAEAIDVRIRNIPHAHRVRRVAHLPMAHDDAEPRDHAVIEPARNSRYHLGFTDACVFGYGGIRGKHQRQPLLQRGDHAAVHAR